MARRAQNENTICKLLRYGLDGQRQGIHRRNRGRGAGNGRGGQRQRVRQKKIQAALALRLAPFSSFYTMVKLYNSGVFLAFCVVQIDSGSDATFALIY